MNLVAIPKQARPVCPRVFPVRARILAIVGQIVANEVEFIATCEIPAQFPETAEGLAPCLRPAQPGSDIGEFEGDASELHRLSLGGIDLITTLYQTLYCGAHQVVKSLLNEYRIMQADSPLDPASVTRQRSTSGI